MGYYYVVDNDTSIISYDESTSTYDALKKRFT